jgi:hypothetical protein
MEGGPMTRVTLDEILRDKLYNLTDAIELCDESGRVVARVYPAADPAEYELSMPPISDEQLKRLEESDEKRYVTADVLAHLETL